jgi:MFS family permease
MAMGVYTTGTVLPELVSEYQLTPLEAGFISSLFTAIMAIVTFFGGYFSDRVGRGFVLTVGAALFSLSFLLVGFATNYITLLICYVFSGFGYGMYSPSFYAFMGEVSSTKKAYL